MYKKDILTIVAIVLLLAGGVVAALIIFGSDNKAEDLDASNKIEITSDIELDNYVGYWFTGKDKIDGMYIHVKETYMSDLICDLYFGNTYLNDVTITVSNGTGELNYTEGDSSLKGELYLFDTKLILTISESTYEGLDIDSTYKFVYKQDDLSEPEVPILKIEGNVLDSKYVGTWYEGYDTNLETNLITMGIDGMTINMYLTIDNINFKVIKTEILDDHGTYETYTRDGESKISGEVILHDESIEIKIDESSVEEIGKGSYEFKLKAKRITLSDYYDKWYLNGELDNSNYIEIKAGKKGALSFDLLYGHKAQILNVNATMKNNIAKFECVGEDERVLAGNVILEDNKVVLFFTNSTVDNIEAGTILEFKKEGGN